MIESPSFVGNLFVSPQPLFFAGDEIGGHTHWFDHTGFLIKGSVNILVDGFEPKVLVAPSFVIIRKHTKHRIISLEDGTMWYCVFAVRDVDGDVSEIADENTDPWFARENCDFWKDKDLNYQPTKLDTIPFTSDK